VVSANCSYSPHSQGNPEHNAAGFPRVPYLQNQHVVSFYCVKLITVLYFELLYTRQYYINLRLSLKYMGLNAEMTSHLKQLRKFYKACLPFSKIKNLTR
jgi:hypothetical protein